MLPFFESLEEAQPELEVSDPGPSGKNSGENCGVEWGNGDPLEHHPAEGDHLGDGANFTRPMGLDFHPGLVVMENPEAAHDDNVAGDNKDDEPWGQLPAIWPPGKDREGGECEEEETLVGQGIEKGSELGELIELPREVAIKGVADGGNGEDDDREPAQGFIRIAAADAKAVIDRQRNKDWDEQQSDDGDLSRQIHGLAFYVFLVVREDPSPGLVDEVGVGPLHEDEEFAAESYQKGHVD